MSLSPAAKEGAAREAEAGWDVPPNWCSAKP